MYQFDRWHLKILSDQIDLLPLLRRLIQSDRFFRFHRLIQKRQSDQKYRPVRLLQNFQLDQTDQLIQSRRYFRSGLIDRLDR
jgi:hypothetical protein